MITKMHRVVLFVKDLNGNHPKPEDVIQELENMKYLEFVHVQDVQTVDIGEWHDDHELNSAGADHGKYFPDFDAGPNDEHLKEEYRRVRLIMLQQIDKNNSLQRQVRDMQKELDGLKKVKEFVLTVKDLTK